MSTTARLPGDLGPLAWKRSVHSSPACGIAFVCDGARSPRVGVSHPRLTCVGGLAVMMLALVTGCEKPPAAPATVAPVPVMVTSATVRSVPIELRAIGTVRVFATVAVRPRVHGEIVGVHFQEGANVQAGDKLFTLDARPYEAQLEQAVAQLEHDLARLRGAEHNLDRAEPLRQQNVLSAEELENRRTEVASLAATVMADQATVRAARLNLEFATITSPIDGRTGNLLVTQGNIVTADQATPLVIINQMSPIAVSFFVPEHHLPTIRENLAQKGALALEADLRDGSPPIPGDLAFINHEVDPTTGMVQLKATFHNEDGRLWPGQYVDVVVTLSERPRSVTVPADAVQEGQSGPYVVVVDENEEASIVPVAVAFQTRDGAAVIAEGLTGGEAVVTDGHLRVTSGSKVRIQPAEHALALQGERDGQGDSSTEDASAETVSPDETSLADVSDTDGSSDAPLSEQALAERPGPPDDASSDDGLPKPRRSAKPATAPLDAAAQLDGKVAL